MMGDRKTSRELLTRSLEQSKAIGMEEGIIEVENAMRRLESGGTNGTSPPLPQAESNRSS
jgi:hypothetical protein